MKIEECLEIIETWPHTEFGSLQLPSSHQIGERVVVDFGKKDMGTCYVRYVIFSTGKVRYGIFLEEAGTTIHNVDSAFITDFRNESGAAEFANFDFDNLS